MNTIIARPRTISRKPDVPCAAIRSAKDFLPCHTFHDYPDLPVLGITAYDVPRDFVRNCDDVSFSIGGIPTVAGMLGTLRLQVADYQASILVNPADPEIRECLEKWRAAKKVGVVLNMEYHAVFMLLDIDEHFALQFDCAAANDSVSAEAFIQLAFGYIRTELLATRATSDLETHPVLRNAVAYLAVTEAIDTEARVLAAQIEALTNLPRRSVLPRTYH